MPKKAFVTKEDLLSALEESGFASKDDVKSIVSSELKASEKRIIRMMRTEHRKIRTDISKLATTSPTHKQFIELKEKVDRFHPNN